MKPLISAAALAASLFLCFAAISKAQEANAPDGTTCRAYSGYSELKRESWWARIVGQVEPQEPVPLEANDLLEHFRKYDVWYNGKIECDGSELSIRAILLTDRIEKGTQSRLVALGSPFRGQTVKLLDADSATPSMLFKDEGTLAALGRLKLVNCDSPISPRHNIGNYFECEVSATTIVAALSVREAEGPFFWGI